MSENAGTIDDKLGAKYGDYARTAARTMQETAAKIDSKDIGELGDDAKEFVRKKPHTTYEPTEHGRAAFRDYLAALERIVHSAGQPSPRES